MGYSSEKFIPDLKGVLGDLYDLYVYIDGKFLRGEDAKISVFDHGLLYGDGVFEGIRAYDGAVFKLDEHIDRLHDSAKAIGIDKIPLTKQELKEALLETLRRNRLQNAHIRVIITRGAGKPGLDPRRSVRPSVIVSAYPFPPLLGEKPVRLITASIRRKSYSIDAKIKSLNYLDNVLAKLQAAAVGVDDAIMLDVDGSVGEGTGENLFVIKNEKIFTPSTLAALHGITRATVMQLAQKLGYEVCEKTVTIQELWTADEVLLSGTGAEITPVAEIDGRKIGKEAPGPITQKIRDAYKAYVKKEHRTPIYK